MPFPRAHRYLTIFGDAWEQAEIWQIGLRLDSPPTAQPDGPAMDALLAAATTWIEDGDLAFSTRIRLLGVKVAPVQTSGLYGDGNDAQERLSVAPVPGVGSSVFILPQSSVVCSLRTSVSRGRGSRGRFYPPPQSPNLADSGKIIPAHVASYAAAHADLIIAINAAGAGPVSVGSSLGAGMLERVTSIRVGDVVDTQRRRRNALPEQYVSEFIPPL